MKRSLTILSLMIAILLCSGCSRTDSGEQVLTRHLARKINITCVAGDTETTHSYTTDTSMSEILNLIRNLDLTDSNQSDPGSVSGTRYIIDIFCDDGSQYRYMQHAGQYFRDRNGSWKQIPLEQRHILPILFYTK